MQGAAGVRRALRPLQHRVCRRPLSTTATPEGIPTHKRVINIVVAFAAGASIYFFLPDPTRAAPTLQTAPFSPRHFTPVTVLSNEESGVDTKLLKLAVPPEVLAASDRNALSTIWSVFIKDDDIQVERPYTPLYGIDDNGHMVFWIKKYPKGEVGRWLHSKVPGEKIEFRGPLSTWSWKNETWDELVMISGGTGFAPFYQLFTSVISSPSISPTTRFTLLHSSRRPEELPPPALLKTLTDFAEKHPERLKVDLFVDNSDHETGANLHVKRIDRASIETSLGLSKPTTSWWRSIWRQSDPEPAPKRRMFLVCGPEPMIGAIAGPYGRNLSQGPVGGALGEMGLPSSEVYKL